MRATVMHGAHDVRIETVPDAHLIEPTDALVRVTRAAICGSDLWPYNTMQPSDTGRRMGRDQGLDCVLTRPRCTGVAAQANHIRIHADDRKENDDVCY